MLNYRPISEKPFCFPRRDGSSVRQSPLLLLASSDKKYQLARFQSDKSNEQWLDENGLPTDISNFVAWAPIGDYIPKADKEQEAIQKFSTEELLDEDGYPTEFALWLIESHDPVKLEELFALIEKIWHLKSFGFHREAYKADNPLDEDGPTQTIFLSTAGWSGNEAIIFALEKNVVAWSLCWRSSQVGGHYEFRI